MRRIEDHLICDHCGGKCCIRTPGICTPGDIRKTFPAATLGESVKDALGSGEYTIDSWAEKKPHIPDPYPEEWNTHYFIRPATDFNDECIFLSIHGCKLDLGDRPTGCAILIPGKFKCVYPFRYSSTYTFGRLWSMSVDLDAYVSTI